MKVFDTVNKQELEEDRKGLIELMKNGRQVDFKLAAPVTDADGVEWYVVECERHFDDINGAVIPSFNFLKSKGRV